MIRAARSETQCDRFDAVMAGPLGLPTSARAPPILEITFTKTDSIRYALFSGPFQGVTLGVAPTLKTYITFKNNRLDRHYGGTWLHQIIALWPLEERRFDPGIDDDQAVLAIRL